MVARAGIGATTASALIFSIILVSNFAVYYASQSRERSYSQANEADLLFDSGAALEVAAATNLLVGVQRFLGSAPLPCSGAVGAAAERALALGGVSHAGNLTLAAAPRVAYSGIAQDNLSALAPFAGYHSGALDFAVQFRIVSAGSPAGVAYDRTETHFLNLPVRLADAADDCEALVGAVKSALGASAPPNCTSAALAPLIARAASGPEAAGTRDGFSVGASFGILGQDPCVVDFQASVIQSGIAGPAGRFDVRLVEGARATVALSPPPRQP